jgi:molecular chaperone DnaJ
MCKVVIETPVRLSKDQKRLLKEFQDSYETSKTEHNPKSSSWLNGVREFFDRMTS